MLERSCKAIHFHSIRNKSQHLRTIHMSSAWSIRFRKLRHHWTRKDVVSSFIHSISKQLEAGAALLHSGAVFRYMSKRFICTWCDMGWMSAAQHRLSRTTVPHIGRRHTLVCRSLFDNDVLAGFSTRLSWAAAWSESPEHAADKWADNCEPCKYQEASTDRRVHLVLL